jgi:hypothetical protein
MDKKINKKYIKNVKKADKNRQIIDRKFSFTPYF